MFQATVTLLALEIAFGVAIHALVARKLPSRLQFHGSVAVGIAVMLLAAQFADRVAVAPHDPRWGLILVSELVLATLFFAALCLYNIIDCSVRARLCVDLHKSRGTSVSYSEILDKYDPARAFRWRFGKLVDTGYVVTRKDGRFGVSRKGALLAGLTKTVRAIYGQGGPSHP